MVRTGRPSASGGDVRRIAVRCSKSELKELRDMLPENNRQRYMKLLNNEKLINALKLQVQQLEEENEKLISERDWQRLENAPIASPAAATRPVHCGKSMSLNDFLIEGEGFEFRGRKFSGKRILREWSCECGSTLVDRILMDY